MMLKGLYNHSFAPVTFCWGFVERGFPELCEGFVSWQEELDGRFDTRTEVEKVNGALSDLIQHLEPLRTPSDRYLLVETHSDWTAIFANGLRVNDVFSPVSYLSERLDCRGLQVACIPDRSGIAGDDGLQVYGAVMFGLYGPHETDWLNRIRYIAAMNDGGKWVFFANGQVQPYEKTENYKKRKIVERFTDEMLESYCASLGIRLFDGGFYGPRALVTRHHMQGANVSDSLSLREARSRLYLE